MINVKNISSKIIGIPQEGGNATLLPDATIAVKDSMKEQMENMAAVGLVEIVTSTDGTDEATEEKKTRGRRKAVEE